MHYNQHGFRPGYSCDSALTGVVGQVEYTILKGKQGIGIFCGAWLMKASKNQNCGRVLLFLQSKQCKIFTSIELVEVVELPRQLASGLTMFPDMFDSDFEVERFSAQDLQFSDSFSADWLFI